MVEDVVLGAVNELVDLIMVCVELSHNEVACFTVIFLSFLFITFKVRKDAGVLLLVVSVGNFGSLHSASVNAYDGLPLRLIRVLGYVQVAPSQVRVIFAPGVRGMGED